MRTIGWTAIMGAVACLSLVAIDAADAQRRKPPYYASISASEARMRTGPGKNYPVSWEYRRADLPIKVVDIYKDWRKVEDPGGTQGWMQVGLLADRRTAIVVGPAIEMRASPSPTARINWRAAPGVVGRISECDRGWCRFAVDRRNGYVQQARLWGVDPGERL